MSKKSKKARVTCLGCGSAMKARDLACRKCGRPSPMAETRKAMLASGTTFVGKAMRPRCSRCGNVSRPEARHCTGCGSALLQVVKSAAQAEADMWMVRYRREANPAQREVFWRLAHPDLYRKGGTAS